MSLDLICLVPGKDERESIAALLSTRHVDLKIRKIDFDIRVHHRRDPGCYREAQDILRPYVNRAGYSLVVFDHEGSGQEAKPAQQIEADVSLRLIRNGWKGRSEVVVISPELENWVWADYRELEGILGWGEVNLRMERWLSETGFEFQTKPIRPKEALEAVLQRLRFPRSSALYRSIAEGLTFKNCTDQAFLKLKATCQNWFGLP